jgi:polyphosphate kinase
VRELGASATARSSPTGAPLDLTGLHGIADLDREELKYTPFLPKTHPDLAEVESSAPADLFSALRRHDVLLHHPYDSFATSVQTFLEQAAADPHVLAIKPDSLPHERRLADRRCAHRRRGRRQAGAGLVEIKARFDEQANIKWARKLEQAGCHVVYGLVGLKTHCKLSLVVRQGGRSARRYSTWARATTTRRPPASTRTWGC